MEICVPPLAHEEAVHLGLESFSKCISTKRPRDVCWVGGGSSQPSPAQSHSEALLPIFAPLRPLWAMQCGDGNDRGWKHRHCCNPSIYEYWFISPSHCEAGTRDSSYSIATALSVEHSIGRQQSSQKWFSSPLPPHTDFCFVCIFGFYLLGWSQLRNPGVATWILVLWVVLREASTHQSHTTLVLGTVIPEVKGLDSFL